VITQAWNAPTNVDPLLRLQILLSRTAKAIQSWSDSRIGSVRRQLLLAKELVFRFDVA
jgi:hypothetical protein